MTRPSRSRKAVIASLRYAAHADIIHRMDPSMLPPEALLTGVSKRGRNWQTRQT